LVWLGEIERKLAELSSSSSFIEPPATGHHRWSGAKKNILHIIFLYDTITMAGND
jgi:hypothetical protein